MKYLLCVLFGVAALHADTITISGGSFIAPSRDSHGADVSGFTLITPNFRLVGGSFALGFSSPVCNSAGPGSTCPFVFDESGRPYTQTGVQVTYNNVNYIGDLTIDLNLLGGSQIVTGTAADPSCTIPPMTSQFCNWNYNATAPFTATGTATFVSGNTTIFSSPLAGAGVVSGNILTFQGEGIRSFVASRFDYEFQDFQAAPEPSAIALSGLGLVGLVLLRFRKS